MKVNESHFDDSQGAEIQIHPSGRKPGIADRMHNIPDSVGTCNDEIAQMLGG